jgi:hypothetical protein
MHVIWLLASLQVAITSPQWDPVEEMKQVELALARYLKSRSSGGRRIGLEEKAQEFATPHAPTGPEYASYRTREHLARLAEQAGAILLGHPVAYCSENPTPDCVEGTIRIGVPQVIGDSAKIWYYTYDPHYLSDFDTRVLAVRSPMGGWNIVRELEFHETLSMPAEPRTIDKLEGCYEFDRAYFTWLDLNPTTRLLRADSSRVIQLFADPAVMDTGRAYFFTPRPGPRDSAERHRWWRHSQWSVIAGDSVKIRWHNGFFGPVFRMQRTAAGLSGIVVELTDVVGEAPRGKPASATKLGKC